jgi:hypothetical protein
MSIDAWLGFPLNADAIMKLIIIFAVVMSATLVAIIIKEMQTFGSPGNPVLKLWKDENKLIMLMGFGLTGYFWLMQMSPMEVFLWAAGLKVGTGTLINVVQCVRGRLLYRNANGTIGVMNTKTIATTIVAPEATIATTEPHKKVVYVPK